MPPDPQETSLHNCRMSLNERVVMPPWRGYWWYLVAPRYLLLAAGGATSRGWAILASSNLADKT
jgi:hypothetical protein